MSAALNKKYDQGLFLFHRDLRIDDNVGLRELCRRCTKVYTCFIFTPEQVGPSNKYKSSNAVQFMIESLEDLDADIKSRGGVGLTILYGATFPALKRVIDTLGIEVVAYNRDYSPYAMQRDRDIRTRCLAAAVDCLEFSDYYLYEPGEIGTGKMSSPPYSKDQKKPYQKYTPFYDNVLNMPIPEPAKLTAPLASRLTRTTKQIEGSITLRVAMARFVTSLNPDILVQGGRQEASRRFRAALSHSQDQYSKMRDQFTYETTFLSAYIKFGCLSIREVYHGIKRMHGLHSGLLRELIWREFFAHVLYGFPDVLRGAFIERYRHIQWKTSASKFERWKTGKTGVPIVDACMRQMNTTGYMHNRGRMVVATFLAKTLLLNWRLGEQYFAQNLTDYDPASNNGNWQSVCSTGVDGKPYFRDMNPWIQSAKFDAEAVFIKRWVPELKDVPAKDIHQWETKHDEYKDSVKYPAPIVSYKDQKLDMIRLYREA